MMVDDSSYQSNAIQKIKTFWLHLQQFYQENPFFKPIALLLYNIDKI